eukprot:4071550-Alexandrium_andersonii.AAC.1
MGEKVFGDVPNRLAGESKPGQIPGQAFRGRRTEEALANRPVECRTQVDEEDGPALLGSIRLGTPQSEE